LNFHYFNLVKAFLIIKTIVFLTSVDNIEKDYKQLSEIETFEKCPILFKFKEDENFNRRNILNISRIALKLHCVPKIESNADTLVTRSEASALTFSANLPDKRRLRKGTFCKGLLEL